MDTVKQRALGEERTASQAKTKATSVLMNKAGHQHRAKEMEFCAYIEPAAFAGAKSEKLVLRPKNGKAKPNVEWLGGDLLKITGEESSSAQPVALPLAVLLRADTWFFVTYAAV